LTNLQINFYISGPSTVIFREYLFCTKEHTRIN